MHLTWMLMIHVIISILTFVVILWGWITDRSEDLTLKNLLYILVSSFVPLFNLFILLYNVLTPIYNMFYDIGQFIRRIGDITILKKKP